MRAPQQWDLDHDVVVAGYGYAGGVSAVFATDAGARTLILEKNAALRRQLSATSGSHKTLHIT